MVIRLVSHSDFLLSELRQTFSVDLDTTWNRWSRRLLLESTAHVMEQSRDGQHDRRRLQVIPVVQEELSVFVTLSG